MNSAFPRSPSTERGCVAATSRSTRIPETAWFRARVLRLSRRPAAADPLLQNHSGKVEQTCRFVPGTGSAPPIFRKLVLESAPARPGARRRVSPHSRLQRVENSNQSANSTFLPIPDPFHQFCQISTDKKISGHICSHLFTFGQPLSSFGCRCFGSASSLPVSDRSMSTDQGPIGSLKSATQTIKNTILTSHLITV